MKAPTLKEALEELAETIKIHKLSVLSGMTKREQAELTASLHKANQALLGVARDKD